MFKKLSLLFFIVIAVPSCMIYSTTKKDMERKIDGTCNIPDLLTAALAKNPEASTINENMVNVKKNSKNKVDFSDQISDILASLATNPIMDTLLDSSIDCMKKYTALV